MRLAYSLIIILVLCFILPETIIAQRKNNPAEKANWRIDNNGYWKKMAEKGLTTLNPMIVVPEAKYTGSGIDAFSTITLDSPDVPVTNENSTQSENSIFVNPADPQNILNSNNSTDNPYPPLYGANDLYSYDGGLTWTGEIQGAGVDNSGDPAVVIGNNGWYYVNHIINNSYGQQVAYSSDQGATWTVVEIDDGGLAFVLDKNHFWIDNNLDSPYEGNLYCAWTDFGGIHNNNIALSYSSDQGLSWSSAVNVSMSVNAGSHCQGVNINTGPNGEVYAAFAIYDAKADENAFGLARSFDGGSSWEPAIRIIENVRGIRSSTTSKNMRVNSFPVIAVDNSSGPYNGNLYMVWTNIGVPGINTGSDIDVYMIRSEDQGESWSDPIRVNQDDPGLGNEHYFPWITCDPVHGNLSVIFYDDRNVGGTQCEVYCANSFDAGETWEDFKVSDVSFTPAPIPGLAEGYMGDYLGITAYDSYVYPCWTDNRTGTTMTYVSPYTTNNLSRPYNLVADLDEETGSVELSWQYDEAPGFSYFIIYRDASEIGQTVDTIYNDQLPDYGIYQYKVTAYYEVEGESSPAATGLQWGNPHIFIYPDELIQSLQPDETATQYLNIINTGELELHYDISTFIATKDDKGKDYCTASGGCDEYIGNVSFGSINNTSGCDEYTDYTSLIADISIGETIPITVTNGNTWDGDVCGIWIDWDQDDEFDNDESINVSGGPDIFTANITPPDDALGGMTRMRIRIQYYGNPDPCGETTFGEVEDYSVNVISWLMLGQNTGTILPGDTNQIAVYFDATDMEVGDYFAEFTVSSDDPDIPEIIVPVTMHVSEFIVTALADPEDVCIGSPVQLNVDVIGGQGSYAYSWTSDPPGFTSSLRNPVVTPLENTTYHVTAADGVNFGEDDIIVNVHEYPNVSLGSDTTVCDGEIVIFDAGEGFASYLWQDGSEEQTFNANEEGYYWVRVTSEYGCTTTDSVYLGLQYPAEQPAKPAGPSFVDLYDINTTLYTSSNSPDVIDFQWELIPATAGVMNINGHEITINWDTTFTGSVLLKVMTTNICGSSPWSDSLEITVVNTFGIGDLSEDLELNIFPNPNHGSFIISMSSDQKMSVNIYIIDHLSKLVYNRENIDINRRMREEIHLEHLPSGIYNVIIENDKGRIRKQIIII